MKLADKVFLTATGSLAPEADSALTSRIGADRTRVEAHLAASSAAVYGFNTLFGPLDGHRVDSTAQGQLLQGHLVGTPMEIPGPLARLVLATKVQQLGRGGSGIHPETFAGLARAAREPLRAPFRVAFGASYGSADVVPAAWFVAGLVERKVLQLSHPGDLMTLINGNHVSTASAIAVHAAYRQRLEEAARLVAAVADSLERGRVPGRQLPVSLRDTGPLQSCINSALDGLEAGLEQRLSVSGANPLFEFAPERTVVRSNSGFLDFGLTFALTTCIQALHVAAGYLQRAVEHASDHLMVDGPSGFGFVQPPKVAQAIVEKLAIACGTMPIRFSGQDSHGIEDCRDLSLLTVLQLARGLAGFDELLSLGRRALGQLIGQDEEHPRGGESTREAPEATEAAEIVAFLASR
ncbi:hypothetical protein GCM10023081_04970 [Arthrobacter ginkgonis]|uniref:Histidine ammonia-lyase n=1 Tax=Arthrobacter ginkgonis TaxID=1630594 RepID=A0ABP7BWU2_9MICC